MRQRSPSGTARRRGRPALLIFVCLGFGLSARAAPPSPLSADVQAAWERVATLRFDEAIEAFARIEDEADSTALRRTVQLGRAAAALQSQPRTETGVRAALADLDALAATSPADDVAIAAAYLAARVVQDHLSSADPAEAARRFRQLHARHGSHPLGQIAWVRWALLSLYDGRDPADPASAADHLARLEREGSALTDRVAVRDFHLLLAYAYPDLAPSDEAMLRHLLAAEATGILRWQTLRDVYVQIVETALALGRADVVRTYFARYEAAYPRDQRRQLLGERIAALLEEPR